MLGSLGGSRRELKSEYRERRNITSARIAGSPWFPVKTRESGFDLGIRGSSFRVSAVARFEGILTENLDSYPNFQ